MDLEISGKGALVLASSQGLGLGVAEALVREGVRVVICGRSADKLKTEAERLTEMGPGKATFCVADLSDRQIAQTLFDRAKKELGRIDILVNNTGGPPPGSTSTPDSDSWSNQFDAMVLRVIEMTKLCLPDMQDAGWGRVLTLASSGVLQPIPNLAMSNTLRSALVGWSKSLSNEVAEHGITVNMLLPGRIHTARVDQLDGNVAKRTGKSIDEVRENSRGTIPAKRYGDVSEFADVAAFLLSSRASYVTGSVIRCDGGAIKSV